VFCQKKIEALHLNWCVQDTIMSSRSNRISRSIFATSKMPARFSKHQHSKFLKTPDEIFISTLCLT
jgi:hypothetical protein